jgi:hypothetical protein
MAEEQPSSPFDGRVIQKPHPIATLETVLETLLQNQEPPAWNTRRGGQVDALNTALSVLRRHASRSSMKEPPHAVDFALPPDPPPRGPMLIHPPLWCMLFFVACMLGLLSYVIWVAIHG